MLMNILVTDPDPQRAARNLDNLNVQSQIVTIALLMAAYARKTCYPINDLWIGVNENHPWLRWMLNEEANIDWVKDYGIMLLIEYGFRYQRQHKGSREIYNFIEDFGMPIGVEPKAFLNRAWDDTFDFRHEQDVPKAYRHYMNAIWTVSKRQLSWGDRMPPAWFIEEQLIRAGKELNDTARAARNCA
jgi:hypothetical protein